MLFRSIGLNIDVMLEPWASLFDAKGIADAALLLTPSDAAERVNALVMALEKLARLGGPGGGYGNSDGNVIAQKALADWRRK